MATTPAVLVEALDPNNRYRWAQTWKSAGKRIVAVEGTVVPEEIVHACGMLPLQLLGTERAVLSESPKYLPTSSYDFYTRHVLEGVLTGQLEFLDGAVVTDSTEELNNLAGILQHIGRPAHVLRLDVPCHSSPIARQLFRESLNDLRWGLERIAGVPCTDESLRRSIRLYNQMRQQVRDILALCKDDEDLLSGTELFGLMSAALVMPKEDYVTELADVLTELKSPRDRASVAALPRLMVCGNKVHDRRYVELIESEGSRVVVAYLDTGWRYFAGDVSTQVADPLQALAEYYLAPRRAGPSQTSWQGIATEIVALAEAYHVEGIVFLPEFDMSWLWAIPYIAPKVAEAGYATLTLPREYVLTRDAWLRTRVGAFIESLPGRR